jgi:signal transduction histidine kinase
MQLERNENREADDRSYDELLALSISRLDTKVGEVIRRERSRPYEHFRALYKPARVLSASDLAEVTEPGILLPSPIRTLPEPDWILLHFQASEAAVWQSPQLELAGQFASPEVPLSADERARLAEAADWLASLQERFPPLTMLDRIREAEREAAVSSAGSTRVEPRAERPARSGDAPEEPRHIRTETEFWLRIAQVRDLYDREQCEPELVALENLGAPTHGMGLDAQPGSCVSLTRTPMVPLWLDLPPDGRLQLAFVCTLSVDANTSPHCALQGFLIDWERLHEILKNDIRDLFPEQEYPSLMLVPSQKLQRGRPRLHTAEMTSLPVLLSTGPPLQSQQATSIGLRIALAVSWLATLLALAAVTYGTIRYFTMAERRMHFVAAVTHELRTPLTTFQLYTDLLADESNGDPQRRRTFVQTLRAEAARLGRLVENVLTYSRMGGQRPALDVQSITPRELMERAAAETRERCDAAGKQLVIEDEPGDANPIQTDPAIVVQILSNLIENACKYSGDGDPHIWMRASAGHAGRLDFEVDDAGPGVPYTDRRAVFEPFRRGRDQLRSTTGMGLGLALSRHWAECLGGDLILKRSARNGSHYSCFALTLPIEHEAPAISS